MKALKVFWLNVSFYSLLILYSAISVPLLAFIVAGQAVFLPHRAGMKRFRRAISWYGAGVIRLLPWPLIRIRYEDTAPAENEGPFLVVCNHRAASDPFLMACLPFECVQVVNTWPFRLPIWGITARLAGYLSIKEMSAEAFIERAGQLLRQGVTVISFPEGTRSGTSEMGHFHGTVFRLAIRARASILPLCISGNERMPARGSFVLRPGTVRVRKLPALRWEQYKDLNAFQLKNRVRELMSRELRSLDAGQ